MTRGELELSLIVGETPGLPAKIRVSASNPVAAALPATTDP
nr:hypothetical protein [Corynebacterium silvaticum]